MEEKARQHELLQFRVGKAVTRTHNLPYHTITLGLNGCTYTDTEPCLVEVGILAHETK